MAAPPNAAASWSVVVARKLADVLPAVKYLLLMFALLPMAAHTADVVSVCQLGSVPAHRIEVTRDAEIADSYIYKLGYAGASQYFYDSADFSRGLSVHIACVGKKRNALVAYGEFTSNFLQGFVIVRSPQTGKLHRLDFAERSPPQWLYTNRDEILVIIPTHGSGEYGGKFIVYRRANTMVRRSPFAEQMFFRHHAGSKSRSCKKACLNENTKTVDSRQLLNRCRDWLPEVYFSHSTVKVYGNPIAVHGYATEYGCKLIGSSRTEAG